MTVITCALIIHHDLSNGLTWFSPATIAVEKDPTISKWIAFNSLALWIRLLGYLRPYRILGTMIRTIIEIIEDCLPFLVLFVIILFGFTHAFFFATEDSSQEESVMDALAGMYNLVLGNFDTSSYGSVLWILFIMGSFFLTILMLNMLIAVMADTYSRMQDSARENSYLQWAKVITEMDQIKGFPDIEKKFNKFFFIGISPRAGEELKTFDLSKTETKSDLLTKDDKEDLMTKMQQLMEMNVTLHHEVLSLKKKGEIDHKAQE